MRTRTTTRTRIAELALAATGIALMGAQWGDGRESPSGACSVADITGPISELDQGIRAIGMVLFGLALMARIAYDRRRTDRAARRTVTA